MLKINEVFYSIQGEGFHTGMPAVFVRLSGCNLTCDFCDTKHTKYHTYEEEDLVRKLKVFKCKNIIITGGEPLLQNILSFVKLLKKEKYYVCIETNGTINSNVLCEVDWITVSPKERLMVCSGDELKLVYQGQPLKCYETLKFDHYYIQPCSMGNIQQCVKIVKNNPLWRLSLQCQKLIDIK